MKTTHALLAALICLGHAAPAIDLRPATATSEIAGFHSHHAIFRDGEKKLAVTFDEETEVSASDSGAMFRFKNYPLATIEFRGSPMPPGTAFSQENLAHYEKAARALLPAAATGVVLDESTPDPAPINDWRGHRFTFSYAIAAQSFTERITFLSLDAKQQIVIKTGCQKSHLDQVTAREWDILRSWHEILPGDELGLN